MQYGISLSAMVAAQAAILVTAAAPAAAQTADSDSLVLEEVVVTAQRRAESLQEVPVAITALSAEALENRQITEVVDMISTVPNLHISNNIGQGSATTAFIRGVGETDAIITIDAPVGFYLDDVYLGRTGVNNLFLFDTERVEVLRGPQGTLYGRNTSAGAIKLVSRKPVFETEGRFEASYGRFDEWRLRGMLNTTLSDDTAVRGSFIVGDGGGDTFNIANDTRVNDMSVGGAKLATLTKVSDRVTLELGGDWTRTNQNGRYGIDISGILREPTGSLFVANTNEVTENIGETWGVSANVTWEASDTVSVKSITAFRNTNQRFNIARTDQPTSLYVVFSDNDSDQFSQEFQITGSAVDGRLNYVAGLFYFNERSTSFIGDFIFQSLVFNKDLGVDVDSYAAFAQFDYDLSDRLTLIVGGRFTRDEKSIDIVQRLGGEPGFEPGGDVIFDTDTVNGQVLDARPDDPVRTDLGFSRFNPKIGLEYAVSDDLNLYATYTQGFKSGGWSARVTAANEFFDFDPEEIDSFEVGAKGTLIDGRGQFSLAGFYYDYRNLFNTGTTADGSFGIATSDAEIYGVELETNWQIVSGLSAFANASFQEGERNAVSAATIALGDELQRFPQWQAAVGLDGVQPLSDKYDLIYNASYTYMDEHFVNPQNTPSALTGPVDLVNAQIGIATADGAARLTLGCRNCFGELYIDQILDFAPLGFITVYPGERARWTAMVSFTF